MTKTKSNTASSTYFGISAEEKRRKSKMEPESGFKTVGGVQTYGINQERKKANRTPSSSARPKDVPGSWSIGTPTRSVKPEGETYLGSRLSRRHPSIETKNEKKTGKSTTRAPGKHTSSLIGATKMNVKSNKADRRKVSDTLSKESVTVSPTDRTSEFSDCASEENLIPADSQCECGVTGSDRVRVEEDVVEEQKNSEGKRLLPGGPDTVSEEGHTRTPLHMTHSTSVSFSDLTEEMTESIHEECLREIEELKSENDYLKDEVEELHSEMLEMRDTYMEEDMYQLQELSQQLEQANKTCRILRYRLRKVERRNLRVAQTGQVDGELIRTLEQDVKVAKDVSIRLHKELDAVEKKRSHVEQENEELQVKFQEMEVAKQVLQAELERIRENFQKKRGTRLNNKPDKKMSPQLPEDSSDLMCQLHFAKEESALMCKKLTKMGKDNEVMREELTKYRSLYGDMNASLTENEVENSPHTREAEVRIHLKLVEEEANLLSRRIVELEVENRGLRAEMDDMKIQETPVGLALVRGVGQLLISPSSENVVELQRHLQFVEEEADLLRRSLTESEEQNKLLMNELNRFKSELLPDPDTLSSSSIFPHSIIPGLINSEEGPLNEASQEELLAAQLQITDLNNKLKKLQYENRLLLSNVQHCDLVSRNVDVRPALETDAEAEDSVKTVPSPECNVGQMDGEENQPLENKGEKVMGSIHFSSDQCPNIKELLTIRDQAQLIASAIQLLMSVDSFSSDTIVNKITDREPGEAGGLENNQVQNSTLFKELDCRLQSLHVHLQVLTQMTAVLGESTENKNVKGLPTVAFDSQSVRPCPLDSWLSQITVHQQLLEQVCELQGQLCEAKEKAEKAQEELALYNQAHHDYTQSCSQKLFQLQEEYKKVLVRWDFQLQSLSLQIRLQQKFWSQEKNVLVEESEKLKEILLLVSLKLRWLLKQWRLGKSFIGERKDMLKFSIEELYLPLEDNGLAPRHGATKEQMPSSINKDHSLPENNLQQASGLSVTLADLKVGLQDLSIELLGERQSSQELIQKFAQAKASWEVERNELKSLITQLEGKAGKMSENATDIDPPDLRGPVKRDLEEHHLLLADSYAAVMDLTKQLQINERNWSREKLELLNHFNQERNQWEKKLHDAQTKGTQSWNDNGISTNATTNDATLQRTQPISSLSDLEGLLDVASFRPDHEVEGTAERKFGKPHFIKKVNHTDLCDLNQKNWKYLNRESASLEMAEPFKTWDCPSTNLSTVQLGAVHVHRSYTAPDKTGIRIYYSPPAVRRMERKVTDLGINESQLGFKIFNATKSDQMVLPPVTQPSSSHLTSSYEQWLSSLSQHHRGFLEGRACSSGALHTLEISANLSDDMKEMTSCVWQAISSSSLERKCRKDAGIQTAGLTSTGTQTARFVSVAMQTESPTALTPRGAGFHGKLWSPRPSTSLTSARSRHISSTLEKVHSRVDRPCCSPKYGSPKLTRRVSASCSPSKLETSSSSSRDRSMWNLPHRSTAQSGSAWARSTTTRDSPILSGLNDGLSSLFSVVEHTSNMESPWKGDSCPGKQAAGKASCPNVGISLCNSATQRYGIMQEFCQNVCEQTLSGEKSGAIYEPKPECLKGVLMGTDSVAKLMNKRLMKQTLQDEAVVGGKEPNASTSTEDSSCDCKSNSLTSCFAHSSRSTVQRTHNQCKHRVQETVLENYERLDASKE